MKLRNFLYLNTKVIEDYVSAIDGYTYDEELQEYSNQSENTVTGKATVPIISADGTRAGKHGDEVKRTVKISNAAKFDKIYKYLQSDDTLKYYEYLPDDVYGKLCRDDFLEVLVSARFSKMKEITDGMAKFAQLARVIETFTEQQIMDKKTTEAVNGLTALGQLKSGKEITCVFEFEDGCFPMVAYLDESYFCCGQENFVGRAYLLCKIIRKVPKGQSIKLDEIFDDIKKLPLNRGTTQSYAEGHG